MEQRLMEIQEIRDAVKRAISQVTGIDAATIPDSAAYEADLGLDSLSILEIAVNVESQFKIQATDEELSSVRTIDDTVDLVRRRMPSEVV
jgi:acyl carrier protein